MGRGGGVSVCPDLHENWWLCAPMEDIQYTHTRARTQDLDVKQFELSAERLVQG